MTMNHPERLVGRSTLPGLLLCFTLVACGGGTNPEVPTTSTTTDSAAIAITLPNSAVTAKELACVQKEYVEKVHWGTPASHSGLTAKVIRFTVASYNQLMNATNCGNNKKVGLMVHYGANASEKALSFAYSVVCMELDGNNEGTYTMDSVISVIDSNDRLVAAPIGISQWRQTVGKVFQENIVVDKYDNNRFQYIYRDTYGHITFTKEQVDDVIAHNALGGTDHVEVVPIAEPLVWPRTDRGADFTLRTCLVGQKDGIRRIDDVVQPAGAGVFAMRGSDLGSACPPLCDVVAFPSSGVAVRASCQ